MLQAQVTRRTIGVIGAGIAGPVFALQMLSHPTLRSLYKLTLYDQGPDPRTLSDTELQQTAGAAIAISPSGLYPLYQLGLKDAIEKISIDIIGLSTWRAEYGPRLEPTQRIQDAVPGPLKLIGRTEYASWAEDLQTNMRAMERRKLRSLLLDRVRTLGGDISWNKRLRALEDQPDGKIKAIFDDAHESTHNLIVGADGGWSHVRRHIIHQNKPSLDVAAVDQLWAPASFSASNIYGVSSPNANLLTHAARDPTALTDTHGLLLPRGILSTSPLPGRKIRWDLMIPETFSHPEPHHHAPPPPPPPPSSPEEGTEPWHAALAPSPSYPRAHTTALLRAHAPIRHPATGTFGALLASSARIIHAPLRQRAWDADAIAARNAVVIGDAARLLLPSSGAGSAFAVEDAVVLAGEILNAEAGLGGAAEAYARARVARSKRMGARAEALAEVVLGDRWWWRVVRDGVFVPLVGLGRPGIKKDVRQFPFDLRVSVQLREEQKE